MASEPAYTSTLELSELRLDCGVTPHHATVKAIVDLFVHDLNHSHAHAHVIEPIVVFQDNGTIFPAKPVFWVADGHHRVAAFKECGEVYIAAKVYYGSRHDAMFYAARANAERRGNKDKHAALVAILREPELAVMSDRMLAVRCKVHHTYLSRVRNELGIKRAERTVTAAGYTINSGNIGRTKLTKNGRVYALREGQEHRETRIEQVKALTKKGFNDEQIAAELNLGVEYVRAVASRAGVALGGSRTRKLNHRQVIDTTVLSLDASAAGLRTTGIVLEGLDREEVSGWLESIEESLRTFTALRNKLRGYVNEQGNQKQ